MPVPEFWNTLDTVDDLLSEFDAQGIDLADENDLELFGVFQPNYPLVARVAGIERRGKKLFIHLSDGESYYSGVDDDEEDDEE